MRNIKAKGYCISQPLVLLFLLQALQNSVPLSKSHLFHIYKNVLLWIQKHFPLPCYEHYEFFFTMLFSLRDSHSNDLPLLQVTTSENAGSQQIPKNVNTLEAIIMRRKLKPSWVQASIMWHCWLMQVMFLHRSPRSEIQSQIWRKPLQLEMHDEHRGKSIRQGIFPTLIQEPVQNAVPCEQKKCETAAKGPSPHVSYLHEIVVNPSQTMGCSYIVLLVPLKHQWALCCEVPLFG